MARVGQAVGLSLILLMTAIPTMGQADSLPHIPPTTTVGRADSPSYVPPTTTVGQAVSLPYPYLCLWSDQGLACVERVGVAALAAPEPTAWLEGLLAGPTPQERARGLRSAIPPGTLLAGLDVRPDRTVVVRLEVPFEALRQLDHATFDAIVEQIGWTLEPLRWRALRIQTWDPIAGEFVPLAAFLPTIEPPRKTSLPLLPAVESPRKTSPPLLAAEGETAGGGEVTPTFIGQPPAPGQAQPQGALTGKTIYVSAGHGWEWDYDGRCNCYRWHTQRPVYQGFIEDHNNAEAVDQYLLRYLWNAGATVIPVRERDMNPTEVVVDNDDPDPGTGYEEEGTWTTSSFTGYNGGTYRYALTVPGEATATAVWTATLPADGEYAVYVWYRQGSNRARDAHYVVHHAGGSTEVVVNQQVHGNTWRYLGTYGFRGGEVATVTLSNRSAASGTVVIADAVRFGGGTFDSLTGIDTIADYPPDKPWWEVAAYYYVQRMGMDPEALNLDPDDPRDNWGNFNDVVARPIYARWEHAGTGEDAIYISWHTNGYNGTARGTETYVHSGDWLPRTPGSYALAGNVHGELVHDIRAGWDPYWTDRGVKEKNLGELRLLWDEDPDEQMPGALVEIAFHDNPDDAAALKEPAFQMLAARAIYQGIVKYFAQRDGVSLPLLPEPPTHLAVRNVGGGRVRVSWHPSPTDTVGLRGDPATGYRVYTSTNGLGWSNGVAVGNTTAYTLTGLSPGQLLFVRVTATNDGGESFPTETLAVRVGDEPGVLLVNGFDRLNRTMLVEDYDPVEGYNLRMLLDRMNTYAYTVQHGEVISAPFDSASNEAVRDGDVALTDYVVVDWILGEESAPDQTLDPTERSLLEAYLAGGGALFISGAEIGWHLDYLGADPGFYNDALRADYVADDAGTYEVAPVLGSIFERLAPFRFDAVGMYDADYPDVIEPVNGAAAALTYSGGAGGVAAVEYENGCERLVYFGFPFETIDPDDRAAVMERVMEFLDECLALPVETTINSPSFGSAHNVVPPFSGTAEAHTGTLQRVEVQVEREGLYWSGSGWVTATTWLTATGTISWSFDLTPVLATGDGSYTLRARAVADSTDLSPAEVWFTYDTAPPGAATLRSPTEGSTVSALPDLVLEWDSPPPDNGSPYGYVVALDGVPYTTTTSVYTVTDVADGVHQWGVQVFDAAGNRSRWVTATFTVSRKRTWLPVVLRSFQPSPPPPQFVNGGFETDEGWVLNHLAVYDGFVVHEGARSVRLGILPGNPGAYVYSSVSQSFLVPDSASVPLKLWVYPYSDGDVGDLYYVSLYDQAGQYHALGTWHPGEVSERQWNCTPYDLSPYRGQVVTLYIGVKNDGDDDTAAMYVDDVALEVCP